MLNRRRFIAAQKASAARNEIDPKYSLRALIKPKEIRILSAYEAGVVVLQLKPVFVRLFQNVILMPKRI